MDSMSLFLFLVAPFLGGLTSGLSGFAMGLVVSGVWLHIIAPDQNALLIVLCGIVTQGAGIWRVRKSIDWKAVAPFIIGSALGVQMSASHIGEVPPEQRWLFLIGLKESLHNLTVAATFALGDIVLVMAGARAAIQARAPR